MQTTYSIVIRSYNEEQHLSHLLTGIGKQSISDPEIILVDSGSTDATLTVASEFPVKIIQIEPDRFSFGRSLNIGCKATNGEYVVIASAHVYPMYNDWIEQLLGPFEDPTIALTYGKQRGNKSTQYSEQRVFEHWFPEVANRQQRQPFCNNANSAIRRSLWEQLPYNEDLTGLEDLDWAQRVLDQGYHLAYVPEAEVVHVHNERPIETYNRYRREAIAFKRIFTQEQFHFWDFVGLWVRNTVNDWRYARNDKVIMREWWRTARFRLMQFWGTYRGYQQRGPLSQQLRQTFYYPDRGLPEGKGDSEQRADKRIHYDQLKGGPF